MPRRDHYEGESPYGAGIEGASLISAFRGEHAFLSNFHEEPFDCGGRIVPTAEHAYQAQKTWSKLHRDEIAAADGPRHAKFLGRRAPMKPNWDEIKVSVMRQILAFKFAEGSTLGARLAETFPAHLIEGNHWGDTFWGCVHPTPGSNLWVGSNHLGLLLMERRKELLG